ncbi:ABC transporter permease [Anaerocolumna sp. AGMB13020]|uniref:ABC transporter permease n=1 Tax=Anaerocolumna sp. AGMB13020 TaxID=3081750 RepID=UPI0029535B6F|nr:ABC transporter permease [Anaerocolumna sp. AGMB13020]WOO36954.1 ABC transporter permease [Anaerocolumna sp. AGMB13020]
MKRKSKGNIRGNLRYSHILLQNLKRKINRTILLSSIFFIMIFTIFLSANILYSMKEGLNSTVNRIGADILLVPEDYISSVKDALFLGQPSTIYFDRSLEQKAAKAEGVEKVSSQLFLATIYNSPCCDEAIQMIAYNPATDFLVQPWISKQLDRNLPDGEIVVGSKLSYKKGDTATFFGRDFKVAGKLKETGMGYDNSVFLNFNTAQVLLKESIVKNYLAVGNRENVISLITIKINKDAEADKVAAGLQKIYKEDGVSVQTSGKLVEGIAGTLNSFTTYFVVFGLLLISFTVLSLIGIFSLSMNERKREYGIIQSLGGSKGKILRIIIGEAAAVGTIGSVAASIIASLIVSLFHNFISQKLKLPYLSPGITGLLGLTLLAILLSVLTGVIAAGISAISLYRMETYTLIRENE